MVFVGFHVYWYLGGHLGRGDMQQTYPVVTSLAGYTYAGVVHVMFVAGAALPLSLVQPWGHRVPRRLRTGALMFARGILTLRGVAGLVDDLVRVTGLLDNGLTGLSYADIFDDPNPSNATLLSSVAIDVNFVIGGLLFGWAARRFVGADVGGRPSAAHPEDPVGAP